MNPARHVFGGRDAFLGGPFCNGTDGPGIGYWVSGIGYRENPKRGLLKYSAPNTPPLEGPTRTQNPRKNLRSRESWATARI